VQAHEPNKQNDQNEPGILTGKSVSRREFLRVAGIAGAAIGLGAGLGGALSACGGSTESSTTTSAAAATTTTAGAAETTTSVAAEAEMGDQIKVGFVTPLTGPLASFGVPDKYCVDRWNEYIGDGLVGGDKKKHPVKIEVQDSQSDVSRASQVAGDLINNASIDLMMVASTPDTVTPVVEQCEAGGVPCVSTDCPWQTYLGQNMETGYKWSYHVFFGGEDWITENWAVYEKIPSNKKIGAMFDNTADGLFFSQELPPFMQNKGYTVVDPGRFQPGTEDFTSQIAAFKKAGVELITGNMIPPDFTNFWKAAAQQGLSVKAVMVGKCLLFPDSVDALGEIANGLIKEEWWHRTFPWKSSLTGETCAQLADDFEAKTGKQQTAPLLHYLVGEMAVYAIKNATDPKSKDALLAAIETMKFDSIVGPVDFTAPLIQKTGSRITDWPGGPGHKTKNVYDHGLGAAQWLMQGGKWTFDEVPIDNTCAPYMEASTLVAPKPLPIAK
jgi:branched-chain amino acid transport system substrate-binding protein